MVPVCGQCQRCQKDFRVARRLIKINYYHVPGGFASMKSSQPLYFYDDDYRQQRHEHVRQLALADDAMIDALRQAADAS
jgi:hypothetical protein